MRKKVQGFLVREGTKIKVNHQKTDSILLNKLQVDFLLQYKNCFEGKLLDAGCGEKPYSLIYGSEVSEAIGCDVKTCVHDQKQVDIFASIENLPFENEEFDTILCTNVLEHVKNPDAALCEFSRVLKKNGKVIISVPFLYPVHEAPYDFQRYTKYGLESKIKNNGLKIETILPWGGPGLMLMVYCNLCLCKVVKIKLLRKICCFLQEISYLIYRKFFVRKILQGRCNFGMIISMGYFLVASKGQE